MNKFGERSIKNLKDVHPNLIGVAYKALEKVDFTVICGYRNKEDQEEAYKTGHSKARFGQSAHNYSLALDFIPYPFTGWEDDTAFRRVADAFLQSSKEMDIDVSAGYYWTSFKDSGHVEISNWKSMKDWRG